MGLMNIRPYTDNVPPFIAWYRDRAHWGSLSSIAPSNPAAPIKFWADNSLVFNNFWGQFGQSEVPYTFLARDENGKPKLTPIGSPDFYATYQSLATVNTYKEFAFMFPLGVPYLEVKKVPLKEAATVNVEGGTLPAIDYPVEFRTDTMFLVNPKTGDFGVIHYQDFIREARSVVAASDEDKIRIIRSICDSTMPAKDKLGAIRVAVQEAPKLVTI